MLMLAQASGPVCPEQRGRRDICATTGAISDTEFFLSAPPLVNTPGPLLTLTLAAHLDTLIPMLKSQI